MLHFAFLCLFVGQVPPPPVPHPPQGFKESSPDDQPPADPQGQREWLFAHLTADLHSQGKLNAQKRQEVEQMVNSVTDNQVAILVQHYQQQLAEAQANLRRLQAYRDRLKVEVERRKQVYEQEQAMAAYGSALAAQPAQWAMGGFYAAPYYYYVPPRHHHRHW